MNGEEDVRVSARMAGAVLVASAALALTGCNSHSGSSHHGKKHKSSSSKHKSSKHKSAGGVAGGSSATRVHASSVAGNWKTGDPGDGDFVAMVLKSSGDTRVAVINGLDSGLCKGSYEQSGRNVHIETSCKKGHKFDSGLIKKQRHGKLTVKWNSGETDVFTQAEDIPTM
jgi:hypothetical protein